MTYYIDDGYATYSGKGGHVRVEIVGTSGFEQGYVDDNLNHPLARDDYEKIGFELLNDRHEGDYLSWAMDYTQDDKGVLYHLGGTHPTIRLHPDGVTYHAAGMVLTREAR